MQEITLEERKRLQFDILRDVHNFCEKHGITYFLSSGTLIGAIRHGGYIPWDDDIDIAMPRDDYDRFFQCYKSAYYKADNLDVNPEWPWIFGKIYDTRTVLVEKRIGWYKIGVHIDIFPIDGLPSSPILRWLHLHKISFAKYLVAQKIFHPRNSSNKLKFVYHILFRLLIAPFSLEYLMKVQNRWIRKYSWDSSAEVASLATTTERVPCARSCFHHAVKKSFENKLFNVPCGYDTWLRIVFGDYMVLPPVEKRVIGHDVLAHWK